MSFDLGDWAKQLRCEMCSQDPPIDLDLPEDFPDDGLPEDFWGDPPDPPSEFDLDFELPDYYPTMEFTDGGFMFGIHGTFD